MTARTPKAAVSRAVTASILSLAFVTPAVAASRALIDVDAAVARSQATGRPILAIAGSTGCVWCKKMAAQLDGDPAVQESADKYVVLLIDTDDPVRWPRWTSRYKIDESGIPKVFVVRADGEQTYGGSGAPRDLDGFLKSNLDGAGTILDDAALAELTTAAQQLTRGWRRRPPTEVVAEINRRLDPKNHAAPARQVAAVAEELRKLAGGRLDDVERDLKDAERKPDAAFAAALTALELRRDYAELPEFGDDLKTRVEALEKDAATAPILERARAVFDAEALYASGKRPEAIAALKSFAAAQMGTPAAAHADRLLARWEKRPAGESTVSASESEPGTAAPAGTDVRRAESQLRLGKAMLSRDPARARGYFEKAIELAPDSPPAAEAKKLLGQ